ncbi:nucleoside-diphosphate-sugar epimerase [Nitrosomonas sp. PY1]|uniref:SDR family oxidoreductase n=1 Tax=Nitrosomonas sp. PY1 TaxID=1803906 RepID=UPI001FC823F6|nr:SDR family oxidoreductase [Nitrosomonas sp. PY1]GKS70332.1 nucleoside-diphosphate-sugar epimerase [Nitrosomonas sp. PY1]
MKKTLLIVGSGDIALRAAPLFKKHYRILGLHRNSNHISTLRSHGMIPIYGDLDLPQTLERISGVAQLVIHLAPPQSEGLRDKRTAHLLSALSRRPRKSATILPQQLIYISTSGVYGDCQGALIDETYSVNPVNGRAIRRVDAEKQIRAWGKRNHVNVSILRVPGIYAADRLPLLRLQQNLPVLLENEDSYTNHIHADDLARIIYAVVRHGKPGRLYHACDDSQLKMGAYFDWVADHFGYPRPPRINREEAEKQISPGMMSFMRESRRLINARLKRELYVKLLYPTVVSGIQAARNERQG